MSVELTLFLVFAASASLVFAFMSLLRLRNRRRTAVRQLKLAGHAGDTYGREPRGEKALLARIGRVVARGAQHSTRLRTNLTRAGWDSRTAPLTYSAIRMWLAVSVPLLSAALAYSLNRTQQEVLSAAAGGLVVAWMIPYVLVARRARMRRKRIRKSLPDALDLMVVCVEAGVGVDAAILRVSDELETVHPELAYEFRVVNLRVNAGIPRIEALREMVTRTDVDDLRSLVSTLIQSEKLGVSIARVLRVSSDALRTKRRQLAEQAARKAPIKMLVPLVLFVLPALMLVILGPAGIHLMRVLSTTLQ